MITNLKNAKKSLIMGCLTKHGDRSIIGVVFAAFVFVH